MPDDGGCQNVLVAVDLYSRFTFTWPVHGNPNPKSTIAVLHWLERHYVTPTEPLSDGGRYLENMAVRIWLAARGSYLTIAVPYTHIGVAEVAVKLVIDRVRKLSGVDLRPIDQQADPTVRWTTALNDAVAVINNRKLSWLGNYSPRQILFGRGTTAPTALHRQAFEDRDIVDAEVQKAFDNEQPGQLVLVRDASKDGTHDANAKIQPKWLGPHRIRQVFDGSVTLSPADGQPMCKRKRVGFELLKSWYEAEEE
ncbi:hypothetical protein NCC49_004799 [Naganishia albida]|nr:hypothetical protein NCC49_004799 [Naganishia albida]